MVALLVAASAFAAHGLVIGPAGAQPSNSHAIVAAVRAGDAVVVTATADISGATGPLALILSVPPGTSTRALENVDPDGLVAVERWTAPAVLAPTCDLLVQTETIGLGADPTPLPPIPADRMLTVAGDFAAGSWVDVTILAAGPDGLDAWLADNGFGLSALALGRIEEENADGRQFLVAKFSGPPPADGAWLPPYKLTTEEPTFNVGQRLGAAWSAGLQEVVYLAPTLKNAGRAGVDNYPPVEVEDECMPFGASPELWYDQELAGALPLGVLFPQWLLETVVDADRCDDCAGDPPTVKQLDRLGLPAAPADTRLTRMRMRFTSDKLDQAVTLEPVDARAAAAIRFVDYAPELEFAYPVCGQGFVPDAGSCPGIEGTARTQGACDTGAGPAAALPAAFAALALALRRGRRAAVTASTLLFAGAAHAADAPPRWTAGGQLTLASTARLVDVDTGERGAPSGTYPELGLGLRGHAATLSPTLDLGVWGALRWFSGHASQDPDLSVVWHTLVEPTVGADVRYGVFAAKTVSPWFSAGGGVSVPLLFPSITTADVNVAPALRLGAGVWLGKKAARWDLGVAALGIVRTDRHITQFAPATGIPGWDYRVGNAALTATLGGAFR